MPFYEKAKKIRLLILDVDGVLTSGHIFYGHEENSMRAFHVHDGLGIKLLRKANIETAVISAKKSTSVEKRLNELGLTHLFLGYENKLPAYEAIKKTLNLNDEAIAYMGDDFPDIPLLKRAGLAVTVPDANDIVKRLTDYVSIKTGGNGAVRELCELILKAQHQFDAVLNYYMNDTQSG